MLFQFPLLGLHIQPLFSMMLGPSIHCFWNTLCVSLFHLQLNRNVCHSFHTSNSPTFNPYTSFELTALNTWPDNLSFNHIGLTKIWKHYFLWLINFHNRNFHCLLDTHSMFDHHSMLEQLGNWNLNQRQWDEVRLKDWVKDEDEGLSQGGAQK